MPRKTTQANGNGATATAEPVQNNVGEEFNPFQLDEMIDVYAQPIASEVIRQRLPERVKHHVTRLMTSNEEADRAELLSIMKSAKLGICFAVYSAVLGYARETAEARLDGTDQASLPAPSSNGSEAA